MTKTEAINTINGRLGINTLNKSNTHFANLNSAKDVWWYDIPTSSAFSNTLDFLNLLSYYPINDTIYHMRVPTHAFRANQNLFVIREDRSTVSLELSAQQANFLRDVRPGCGGVTFNEFLQ